MIKNRPGFVPAKYAIQPEFYTEYFNNITAVFKHPGNGRNILLEVYTLELNRQTIRQLREREGKLLIEYQGSVCRHTLIPCEFDTLSEAMREVERFMSDPAYGDKKEDLPEPVENITAGKKIYLNPVLEKRRHEEYRAKCKYFKPAKPFRFTDGDKRLLKWSYEEKDLPAIEKCANKSVYLLDNETAIPLDKALELLDRKDFLSGIGRSCFHGSSSRETPDGKHTVHFESGKCSPFRKNK